jgi:hypothetical protein
MRPHPEERAPYGSPASSIARARVSKDEDERGVKMPSFFGYMLWSAAVLLPVFAVAHFRLAREGRLAGRAALLARFEAGVAFDRAAAGSTATASISMSAPSRARPEIAMVVLAGRLAAGR